MSSAIGSVTHAQGVCCALELVIKLEHSRVHTLHARFICIYTEMKVSTCTIDDPYLHIVLGCAHEQKAHGLHWIGVAKA